MPEIPMSEVPGHSYVAPDHCAWTDPMCPEPMEKGSMFCRVHKVAARSDILRNVARRFFRMVADVAEDDELVLDRTQAAMQLIEMLSTSSDPAGLVVAAKQHLGPRSVGCFSPAEETSDGRPSTVPPFAEQVLWVRGEVIGWVWPVDASPDSDWRCVTNFAEVSGAGLFGREGTRQARDRAIGWVLEQAHTLREEADRG